MSDCLFCKIAAGDIPADVVFEDDEVIAINDIEPQAPTHVLVLPKHHIATINDLAADEAPLIGRLALTAQRIARERQIDSAGYRLVMNCNAGAGQTVFHIHMHLLGGRQLSRLG